MGWETELADVVAGQPIASAGATMSETAESTGSLTPAALPTDEPDGGLAYVESTDQLLIFRSGAWVPPGVGGTLGFAQVTADQGAISTTEVDLTGLSVAVTVLGSRRLEIRGRTLFSGSTAAIAVLRIKEGATVLNEASVLPNGNGISSHAEAIINPTPGAHTYKLTAVTASGGVTSTAAVTRPAFIVVKDIGPA